MSRLRNKRLCERWLDNLFMVLYEDLRVFTIWRTEMAQYRQQQLHYQKSAEEWEILGELAERLHYTEEAVEAYQSCLRIRFSPKSLKGVLKWYEAAGDIRMVVGALIRLIAWQYRWYSEVNLLGLFGKHLLTHGATVLSCITIHNTEDYRAGRGRESEEHYPGNYTSTTCARSYASIPFALRSV